MSGTSWAERETMAGLRELGSSSMVVLVTERCTIGRDPSNNVAVSGDPCVSRFHSVILFEDGEYFIGDAGSWNGTIVNGEKVFVRRQMKHGDKIRIGLTRFEFVLGISPEKAASIAAANGIAQALEASSDTNPSQTVIVRGLNGGATDPQEDTHSLPDRVRPHDGIISSCRGDVTEQMSVQDRLGTLREALAKSTEDVTLQMKGGDTTEAADQATVDDTTVQLTMDIHIPEELETQNCPDEVGEPSPSEVCKSQLPVIEAGLDDTSLRMARSVRMPDSPAINTSADDVTVNSAGERMPELPIVNGGSAATAPSLSSQQKTPGSEIPEWCTKYFGPELQQLEDDLVELKQLAAEIAERTQNVADKIVLTHDVRNALFLKSGDEPITACEKIFQLMGWTVNAAETDRRELYLSHDGKVLAIARILSTSSQTDREALGKLVVSQIEHWCKHRFEPKGLLILTEPGIEPKFQLGDSNSDLVAYAEAKNICLIESVQFLAMFRDLALRNVSSESFRNQLMTTNGRLTGFNLEPSRVAIEI